MKNVNLKNTSEKIWIFDYDLTLYGHQEGEVLWQLDANITRFLEKKLKTDQKEADRIRQEWCAEFGTTLGGLRHHLGVEPEEYFDFIHRGDNLIFPKMDAEKQKLIRSLQGRKFIFTNGREDWVQKGLKSMGLHGEFERVFDIRFFDWVGKPAQHAYEWVEKNIGGNPDNFIFLEDKIQNLVHAKQRGWTTVAVGHAELGDIHKENPAEVKNSQVFVDYYIEELQRLQDFLE